MQPAGGTTPPNVASIGKRLSLPQTFGKYDPDTWVKRVSLPQTQNNDLPSGASTMACGPCSPPPWSLCSSSTSASSPPGLAGRTRYSPLGRPAPLPLPPPPLTMTYRLSKAHNSPCAPLMSTGSLSTLVSAALPPSAGGVIRNKPAPPWSEAMSRPWGSTHRLTQEPWLSRGTV